ncbi:MAG: nicotinate-nucleotide diphosphorylase, partial [Gaiellales bacterium]
MGLRPSMPPAETWLPLVELALAEDLGPGDVTSPLVVGPDREGDAILEAREPLVVCGIELAAEVFQQLDADIRFHARVRDGDRAEAGEVLAELDGNLRALMACERTALNF